MSIFSEKPKLDKSAWNIILWNLTPYWGVYFLHWNPLTVFICYALETIVIGIFNAFKLTAVYYFGKEDEENTVIGGVGAIPIFITSYGLLAYIHLVMFFALSGYQEQFAGRKEGNVIVALNYFMDDRTTFLALGVFVVSNAYAFVNDFILTQKYVTISMNEQFTEPFPRVIISQLVVFGGMFLYLLFNESMVIVFVLTSLKIFFELYLRKHKAADIFGWAS